MSVMNGGGSLGLKSGDVVEVRGAREIRATLDERGAFEGVPFMAEMERYCGRRFRVFKRADKICVEREPLLDFRRMRNAVSLEEVRCDGAAHDGCQKLCLIFWKEAWLKTVPPGVAAEPPIAWVDAFADTATVPIDPSKTYACQSTALLDATEPIGELDPRQYVRDLLSGALRAGELARVLFFETYNRIAKRRGRREFGGIFGPLTKTPAVSLSLRPGELVRVKSKAEILATLDNQGKNRGMYFAYDMVRLCGKSLPVITPVRRMILETNGKMKEMKNTVLLQGGECSGLCNRGCARAGHPLWREAWLERNAAGREGDPGTRSGS
jgi:hypothetical protein